MFPGTYFPPTYFPPTYFPGGIKAPSVQSSSRDWDIIEDAVARLTAAGAFDGVHIAALPEEYGSSASEGSVAWIEKSGWDEIDEYDDPGEVQDTVRVEFTLTVAVRNSDPAARDRELDRLEQVAKNALDGQSLAGLSIPGWTKLLRGRWAKADAPERRSIIQGVAPYWVDGDDGHNTDA